LFATERHWAPLQTAQNWLTRAGEILTNEEGAEAAKVEEKYQELLEEVVRAKDDERVAEWATTFYTVTRNYWHGLFECYEMEELPRTNNELEQFFGKARHHERRATGHKRPTSALVVRGSVRLVAAVATQMSDWSGGALRPSSVEAWRHLRKQLEERHEARRASRRFRKDPASYLAQLESQLLPIGLPL
jgi:hypothetical protein